MYNFFKSYQCGKCKNVFSVIDLFGFIYMIYVKCFFLTLFSYSSVVIIRKSFCVFFYLRKKLHRTQVKSSVKIWLSRSINLKCKPMLQIYSLLERSPNWSYPRRWQLKFCLHFAYFFYISFVIFGCFTNTNKQTGINT